MELLFESLESLSKEVDFAFGIKTGEIAACIELVAVGVDSTKSSLSPIIGRLAKVDCPAKGCCGEQLKLMHLYVFIQQCKLSNY